MPGKVDNHLDIPTPTELQNQWLWTLPFAYRQVHAMRAECNLSLRYAKFAPTKQQKLSDANISGTLVYNAEQDITSTLLLINFIPTINFMKYNWTFFLDVIYHTCR